MLTFEQVEPVLHKWAWHFRNRRFDHWELINEVWVRGGVQKLSHINLASNRIKWDMIDYMREVTNVRVQKRRSDQGRFYPRKIDFSSLMTDEESDIDFGGREEQPELDSKDYFEWLLRGLNRQCKLIILLKYQCGYNLYEIAKVIGVSRNRVWHLHKVALADLRDRLVQAGEQKRVCNKRTSVAPQDENKQRFYNRMYYMLNKERIQQRRRTIKEKKTA